MVSGTDDGERRPPVGPIPQWVIAAGVPAVVLLAAAAAWLLVRSGATGDRLDAIRTAAVLGVGFGGTIALWLAARRQRSTELDLLRKHEAHQLAKRAFAQSEFDTRERRSADLYLRAVEQLGSGTAAVRHGGLYALERMAQADPSRRQNVVDVVCAYLRAPFRLPDESRPELEDDARGERQVRLSAQRVLTRHLSAGEQSGTFWADVDLDLAGATLIDFVLSECRIRNGVFTDARFVGDAWFTRAEFAGEALFGWASFLGEAWFAGLSVAGEASFGGAAFAADARFDLAEFAGETWFTEASFAGGVELTDAKFTRGVPEPLREYLPAADQS